VPDILSKTSKLGGFPKETFFSMNMRQGELGAANLYSHTTLADSSTLTNLSDVKAYSDIVLDAGTTPIPAIAAQDTSGYIYIRQMGSSTWTEYYKPAHAASAVGIHWDGRYFYYMGTEHVGRVDTQDDNSIDSVGTVSATNGSPTVTGSGTAFNGARQNSKRVKIGTAYYTISTVSGTTMTLTTNYTGTTASGLSYHIFSNWNDTWQDAGSAKTGYLNFQPFSYEGDILFPRQSRISRYNYTDASFNTDGDGIFDAPSSYYWRLGSAGQNGILLGLEPIRGNGSYLVLWDNRSNRSIAPWIPLTSVVQSIKPYDSGWMVITEREIIFTNGYSKRTVSKGFDNRISEPSFSVIPNGMLIVDDKIIIANAIGGYTKKRSGTYVYDILDNSYEYIAPLGQHTYNVTPLAVHMDMNKAVNISYSTSLPAKKYLTSIMDTVAPRAYLITKPLSLTGDDQYAGAIKADFAVIEGADFISGVISAKITPLNRRIFGVQKAKIAGASTSQITVDGTTLSDVQLGDEITIMEGVNAGSTRHISSISGTGTATEVWTLDSVLPSNIEADCYISVTPFQKASTKTITSATELRGMLFNVQNRYKGKQFMVKFYFSGMTVPIELLEAGIIAQSQGPRT
jgi:hypothetical protein